MYNFVRAFREPASDFDFECTQVVTLGVTDQIKSSCLNDFDEKKKEPKKFNEVQPLAFLCLRYFSEISKESRRATFKQLHIIQHS